MIWPWTRQPLSAPPLRTCYTTQFVSYKGEQDVERSVVAPAGHGVTVEVSPVGYLKLSAMPTTAPADNLPIFDGSPTLIEYAEGQFADTARSEADEIAALLGAAGLSCRVWQSAADERTVRYTVEINVCSES